MAAFPKDQFDDLPRDLARVGAHRQPPRRGRGWITFAWAALATGVFVVAGLYGLSRLTDSFQFTFPGAVAEVTETPAATTTPTAEPLTDPSTLDPVRNISITVLNGTATAGLQTIGGDKLTALGWPIGTVSTSSATDETDTVVYYSNPADEDVARGLVVALGVGEVRESTAFLGAPVTIVLGSDFTG